MKTEFEEQKEAELEDLRRSFTTEQEEKERSYTGKMSQLTIQLQQLDAVVAQVLDTHAYIKSLPSVVSLHVIHCHVLCANENDTCSFTLLGTRLDRPEKNVCFMGTEAQRTKSRRYGDLESVNR